MKVVRNMLLASASAMILSACGADDIGSAGTGGNISIVTNNNAPTPTPTAAPTPTPTASSTVALATPASACPTINDPQRLTDRGTITGPTGTYRVCALPLRLNVSSSLPRVTGVLYNLPGRVDIGTDQGPTEEPTDATDVVLTIQPGVVVFADSGPSFLNINRGNQIQAIGNATTPIIFTSRANVEGSNTDNSSGQWGGVILSGRAPVTDCAAPGATPGTANCERQTEGAVDPALYGGATANDNSGRMSFVQIRYSGFVLSANSELQSLTTEGVGSQTVIDHIQSYNSSDDGAEFFGGTVGLKYYISVGAEDDNIDTDTGLKGSFQYVIVAQRTGSAAQGADAMIEADSDNGLDAQTPRHNVFLSNFTFLDRAPNTASDQASILIRGAADYTAVNGILVNSLANPCLRLSLAQTASTTQNAAIDEYGAPQFRSVVFSGCSTRPFIGSGGPSDTDVANIFNAGTNNNANYTPSLTGLFINGATEAAVTPFDASTFNNLTFNGRTLNPNVGAIGTAAGTPFFDRTTYIGAVRDSSDLWYRGWTCNSSTADFGTTTAGSALCTSLPTI